MKTLMKKNNLLSIMSILCFLFLAIGSVDESDFDDFDSGSDYNYTAPKSSRDEKVCQDAYGNWHSHISRCSTCGISYCVQYLPYGDYCSQACCAAYEGLSSKCGY